MSQRALSRDQLGDWLCSENGGESVSFLFGGDHKVSDGTIEAVLWAWWDDCQSFARQGMPAEGTVVTGPSAMHLCQASIAGDNHLGWLGFSSYICHIRKRLLWWGF